MSYLSIMHLLFSLLVAGRQVSEPIAHFLNGFISCIKDYPDYTIYYYCKFRQIIPAQSEPYYPGSFITPTQSIDSQFVLFQPMEPYKQETQQHSGQHNRTAEYTEEQFKQLHQAQQLIYHYSPYESSVHPSTAHAKITTILSQSLKSVDSSPSALRHALRQYINMYVSMPPAKREDFFTLFCEHQFLRDCEHILKKFKNNNQYYEIVLEALNMLSYNLKHDRQIVFFLSRTELNQIILRSAPEKDGETVDVYIQFLRSCTMRLPGTSYWKIFFNSKYATFPLLYQSMKLYNHPQKLVRTTVRSIILEIAQISKFSIKAYLHNFPCCLLFAYETLYMADLAVKIQSPDVVHELVDQIIFVEDLASKTQKPTLCLIYNSVLYNCIRPLWQQIINNESEPYSKSKPGLPIYVYMITFKDPVLLGLLFQIFFSKFISKEIDFFFSKQKRALNSYSFKSKEWKMDKCASTIEQHSTRVFDKFDSKRFQVNEIEINGHLESEQEEASSRSKSAIISNSENSLASSSEFKKVNPNKMNSFLSKLPFMTSLNWDIWLQEELYSLSHMLGISIQLNKPTNSQPYDNLYWTASTLTAEAKTIHGYRNVINPVYTRIQRLIQMDVESFRIFSLTYLALIDTLRNQTQNGLNLKMVMANYIDELPVTLYILLRNRSANNILLTLRIVELINNKANSNILQLLPTTVDKLRVSGQLQEIYNSCSDIMQKQLFNDQWKLCIEGFREVEAMALQFNQEPQKRGRDVLEDIQNVLGKKQKPISQDRNNIYFFHLLRRVAQMISPHKQYTSNFNTNYQSILFCQSSDQKDPVHRISEIVFKITNGEIEQKNTSAHLQILKDEYTIFTANKLFLIYKGFIRNLTLIKDLENNKRMTLDTKDQSLELEFKETLDRDSWSEIISSAAKRIHEIEVQALLNMIQERIKF